MIGVQVIMGNFFDPRMQGRRLNLSPIIISFHSFSGLDLGSYRMFIAVPITAVIKIICQNIPTLKPIAMMMENGRKVLKGRRLF